METKICKHCQTEMPKKAKVCPNCRKKQGGKAKWIIIGFVIILLISNLSGYVDESDKDKNPQKVSEMSNNNSDSDSNSNNEEHGNIFKVGDVIETNDFRISYISSSEYKSDNQFLQPKDGYIYWEFKFSFENISDTDQTVSTMMDWECYADNIKTDQTWIGEDNGLDAKLSPGRKTEGTVYFEIPQNTEKIELEYDVNYWEDEKIVFVGK